LREYPRSATASQGKENGKALVEQVGQRYIVHENDRIRIQAEIQIAELLTTKAQQRSTYKQLIQDVGEYWEEVVKPNEEEF
jgi:hypothetical protein